MKMIDKDTVVAEIKRYKHKADERLKIKGRTLAEDCKDYALQNLCGNLLHFLDTLEVKEVDLNFMLHEYWNLSSKITIDCLESATMTKDEMITFAKHFFELGLKAQKGE